MTNLVLILANVNSMNDKKLSDLEKILKPFSLIWLILFFLNKNLILFKNYLFLNYKIK